VRHHELTLALRHPHRGRYHVTLVALDARGKQTVIGHTSLVAS
jgi:hypothetical protein